MSPAETEAYQLFLLVERGVERVRVQAGQEADTPAACRASDGLVLTVDQAMARPPIPHDVGAGGRCLCGYRPVTA